MGTFRPKTEFGNYDLGEVMSALQKSIRRSLEFEAYYWADECCPKFAKAMWTRLIIISHEDIGIAEPQAQLYIDMCRRQWFEMCKESKQGSARMVLANAILMLCRATKCRLADHFQTSQRGFREIEGRRLEIPDYALDRHTARGSRMRRSWDHFREVGTILHDRSDIEDPYEKDFWRYKPLLKKVTSNENAQT